MPEWIMQMALGAIFIFTTLGIWAIYHYWWKDKDD